MSIVRGTTPTIRYTFDVVDPANIVTAYLSIKQRQGIIIERDQTTMTTNASSVEWTLTQEETLQLNDGLPCEVQMRYRTVDGKAYASLPKKEGIVDIIKEGEI